MSQSRLPKGHPLLRATLGEADPFELADQIVQFRMNRLEFGGFQMKDPADPDGDDPDGDDPDDDEDDPDAADPDSTIKVGDRTWKVSQLQTVMAREKRQGKKSGKTELLREVGFESVEDLKAALEAAAPPQPKGTSGDDEAAKQAQAREAAAAKREQEAAKKARRADLVTALAGAGVTRADIDDAHALLDRAIDTEYDDDDIDAEIESLRQRRPGLFGEDPSGEKPPAQPRGNLPTGGGNRRRPKQQAVFGAGGLARAEKRFGKKQ